MSIDFSGITRRPMSAASLVSRTAEVVHELTGVTVGFDIDYRPTWGRNDLLEEHITSPRRLVDRTIRQGLEAPWIVLSSEPDVQVDISMHDPAEYGDSDDWLDFSTIASYRTASSVVVAIAALIATVELGDGEAEPSLEEQIGISELTLRRIRTSLPMGPARADLEVVCRTILRQVPTFEEWPVLDWP